MNAQLNNILLRFIHILGSIFLYLITNGLIVIIHNVTDFFRINFKLLLILNHKK